MKALSKVRFFDKRIWTTFWKFFSVISGALSFVYLFKIIPETDKNLNLCIGLSCLFILICTYASIWIYYNILTKIKVDIDGSEIVIKKGDLFKEDGLKVIGFNEYFDTKVDDLIIAHRSLNGIYINSKYKENTDDLDRHIAKYCESEDILDPNVYRKKGGKTVKYKLATIVVIEDYILTAFTKFDDENRANLTMTEYIDFLIKFWDRVNEIYAQRNISVPIFGSGITRIKEHKSITDEDLLKIMLWTFKISESRFKYPAKLIIVIHEDKINQINLLDIKSLAKGL